MEDDVMEYKHSEEVRAEIERIHEALQKPWSRLAVPEYAALYSLWEATEPHFKAIQVFLRREYHARKEN